MLFNSFGFLIFFPIVCLGYFLIPSNKYRNMFLLVASYYFYMNWEPVYALLILLSTFTTFVCSLWVEKYHEYRCRKKLFLVANLVINLGILFLFKYFNFINESIFAVLDALGLRWNVPNLQLLLPVGISFYTFQAIGYSIDVYRGTIKAEKNFGIYALFVSFFPQLVAGPIERSANLLPQFRKKHNFDFDNAVEGGRLMLWGFFMKLCVADRLAMYVDSVYNNVSMHNGTSLLLATFFFTIQIYCDFGGYSLIAIGSAKVIGFSLMQNFRRPYFSQSIKEFWGRWHISLSSWFKDYVYIPLGGNRVKPIRHLVNLFITFLVSGVWHGAAWNFVIWGGLHGLYLILEHLFMKKNSSKYRILHIVKVLYCFVLVSFAWIFFRSNTVGESFLIIEKIFTEQGALFVDRTVLALGVLSLIILGLKDVSDEYASEIRFLHSNNIIIRYSSELFLLAFILLFAVLDGGQFIYFQF